MQTGESEERQQALETELREKGDKQDVDERRWVGERNRVRERTERDDAREMLQEYKKA